MSLAVLLVVLALASGASPLPGRAEVKMLHPKPAVLTVAGQPPLLLPDATARVGEGAAPAGVNQYDLRSAVKMLRSCVGGCSSGMPEGRCRGGGAKGLLRAGAKNA